MAKLRRVSPQTVVLGLLVAAAIYGAWKFVPPYIQKSQVAEVLEEYQYDAAKLDTFGFTTQRRERDLLTEVFNRIVEIGVDEDRLEVYFDMNYDVLTAEYSVVIHHPFGFQTTLDFTVEQTIPRDE